MRHVRQATDYGKRETTSDMRSMARDMHDILTQITLT